MRQVLVYPHEGGHFVAECPSLPNCIAVGMTSEEAIENIRQQIEALLEKMRDQGRPIPDDMQIRIVQV